MLHTFFFNPARGVGRIGSHIMQQEAALFQWLKKKLNLDFTKENEQEMAGFLLLWLFFEQKFIHERNIPDAIRRNAPSIKVDHKDVLDKIKEWYITGKNQDAIIQRLGISGKLSDNVRAYLNATDVSEANEKIVVCAVIYKYRSRLFHGVKDFGTVAKKQADRFIVFNQFLMKCIEQK